MGGPCDAVISENTPEEVMGKGWEHMEEAHPDMAASMKDMPQEAKDEWAKKFQEQWDAAPEVTT